MKSNEKNVSFWDEQVHLTENEISSIFVMSCLHVQICVSKLLNKKCF